MLWHEVEVLTTEEASEAIAHWFHEKGAGGVSMEESSERYKKRKPVFGEWLEMPWNDIPEGQMILKGYFPEGTPVEAMVKDLKKVFENLSQFGIDAGKTQIKVRQIHEEDWANNWKQYYKPLKITDKLTVKPTWEKYDKNPAETIIELDPGMAFGTGTHPTTSLCLKVLEQVIHGGETVIDVGTGSGILAIAAAKLGAKRVLALDLDPVAVKSAKENVRMNGLKGQIAVCQSDLLSVLHGEGQTSPPIISLPVQLVVANILAEVIVKMTGDAYQVLEEGGLFLASGIYQNRVLEVEKALQKMGFVLQEKFHEEGWYAFLAKKVGC